MSKLLKKITLREGSARSLFPWETKKDSIDQNNPLMEVVKEYIKEFWNEIVKFDKEQTLRSQRVDYVGEQCECFGGCDDDYCTEPARKDIKYINNEYIRKHIGDTDDDWIAVYYYHYKKERSIKTDIFVIYDCYCPCSDRVIATIDWNQARIREIYKGERFDYE